MRVDSRFCRRTSESPRQGIRQPLSKTSDSKEERAVHKDVTNGPCTSTLVLITVTPSTIESSFLKVEGDDEFLLF